MAPPFDADTQSPTCVAPASASPASAERRTAQGGQKRVGKGLLDFAVAKAMCAIGAKDKQPVVLPAFAAKALVRKEASGR